MRFKTLPQWLHWQENLHFTDIDPGLERIGRVWERLTDNVSLPFTLVTVAGTNGKGSSVALLTSIMIKAGYSVGSYTSPHILRYNERIAVDGEPCDDECICRAFEMIDKAREEISLTYFEFATLASMLIFKQRTVDIVILEVGMGGRLDAVNLFDADIALITPISLDHTHWLGTNREQIGGEKAGILRYYKPVVCSEVPPQSVIDKALSLNADIYIAGQDFRYDTENGSWQWSNEMESLDKLSMPALEGEYQLQNAAAVLQLVSLLNCEGFTVSERAINQGLENVKLQGRFQRIAGDIELILDVTHNQQGATNLAKLLAEIPTKGKTLAIVGMLKDKDITLVTSILKEVIDKWYFTSLDGERGATALELAKRSICHIKMDKALQFDNVEEAYQTAMAYVEKGDRILIFGSFHTIEAALRIIEKNKKAR